MPPIVRSILAVVAGIVVAIVLSGAANWVAWQFAGRGSLLDLMKVVLLANALQCVAVVAGGYVTARLAPSAPLLHAAVLGVIAAIPVIAGMIVMWSLGPHWYPLALAAALVSSAVLGGRLHRGRRAMVQPEQGG